MLIVHRTSSLDDDINFVLDLHGSETLAAAYIFASLSGANYLANNIDVHISCINHIPVELLSKSDRMPQVYDRTNHI